MDEKVQKAIVQHEDYQRLQKVFSLDFVIDCLTNSRRGPQARFIGNLLKNNSANLSLFTNGMFYHELVELEGFRNFGYSDEELGANHSQDSNSHKVCFLAKRKELSLHKDIGQQILAVELPFLSLVMAAFAPGQDYEIPAPPFDILCESIVERISSGMQEYEKPFTIEQVKQAIELYRLGGDKCSGERFALDYAQMYISSKKTVPHPNSQSDIISYL